MIQMIKKPGGTDSDHDDHHGRDYIDHHDLVMMTIISLTPKKRSFPESHDPNGLIEKNPGRNAN